MKRVDPATVMEEIEQLRVNLGLSKAEASRQAGHKRDNDWAQLTRRDRNPISHHSIRVIARMLETVGWGLYMAPLPQGERDGES